MLALLFPGQGSQQVGMGLDVCETSAAARLAFEEADEALGFPISKLCFEGPEAELIPTEIQQPAILVTSIALHRALLERAPGLQPSFVAGHSLGEYTALVAAGALPLAEAVRLVHARGRYMQQAVPEGLGAMAAVLGASALDVEQVCAEVRTASGQVVTPANYNSPQQTVIAGDADAVAQTCQRLKDKGAKRTVPLKVSAPFHCSLMGPAAENLAGELAKIAFRNASPPVITNVEAEPCSEAARMPALLEAQVTAPVRFTEMVAKLDELGVTHFLEIGPGRVLCSLVARIKRRSERASFGAAGELEEALSFVETAGVKTVETAGVKTAREENAG